MNIKKWMTLTIIAGLLGIAPAAFACGNGGACCGHCGKKANTAKATDAKASGNKTTNAKAPAAQR